MCNVILRRVRATIVAVAISITYSECVFVACSGYAPYCHL